MGPHPSTASSNEIDRALERGWSVMRHRHWQQALEAFQQALTADAASPVAWEGLAVAALCLDDAVRSRSANERAYREYLDRHDVCGAARVAIQLAVSTNPALDEGMRARCVGHGFNFFDVEDAQVRLPSVELEAPIMI